MKKIIDYIITVGITGLCLYGITTLVSHLYQLQLHGVLSWWMHVCKTPRCPDGDAELAYFVIPGLVVFILSIIGMCVTNGEPIQTMRELHKSWGVSFGFMLVSIVLIPYFIIHGIVWFIGYCLRLSPFLPIEPKKIPD